MKTKIISLLLVVIMVVGLLAACGPVTPTPTCTHEDANKDGKCDKCSAAVQVQQPCTTHTDVDKNGKCDKCNATVEVKQECTEHVDANSDEKCDNCGATVKAPEEECTRHVDINKDGKCDVCGTTVEVKHVCADADGNGYCDDPECNKYVVKIPEIYWTEKVDLIMQMNRDSNGQQLPDGGKRYLAGDLSAQYGDTAITPDTIDSMVATRNDAAYEAVKVNITYDYLLDGSGYGWSKNIEDIFIKATSSSEAGRPDIFVNFVYDMVSASLKGAFANVYGKTVGQGNNYFTFGSAPNAEDTGDGYMYEYMRSLTLSKHKMYVLASDYFIDTIRAFFITPVNVALMNSIPVDEASIGAGEDYVYKFNSDRDGDGKYTIDDFYELVTAGEWNYETMLQFCNQIKTEEGGDSATYDLRDTVGFALSGTSGLSASGMLYTTSIKIINRDWSDEDEDFIYSYPTTNPDLYDFCAKLDTLVDNSKGVIVVGKTDTHNFDVGTGSTEVAIRERFCASKVLFGGVILIGSLEYKSYQDMNRSGEAGFGIAPIPLYRVDDGKGNVDPYQTQIHNVGRVGGIAVRSQKFEMCSAFLEYQSTHSTEILNEYYEFKLQYEVAGASSGNIAMLEYIRYNVRSSFDKAFEDAIGTFFKDVDPESNANKWHTMIMNAGYEFTGFAEEYARLIGTKIGYLNTLYNNYGELP